MMWVLWLQNHPSVLHLAQFTDMGRWRGICNQLEVTEPVVDLPWPYRREVSGRLRVVGLCRLGGYPGDRDEDMHPMLPICWPCLKRHAESHLHLVAWLQHHQPNAEALMR